VAYFATPRIRFVRRDFDLRWRERTNPGEKAGAVFGAATTIKPDRFFRIKWSEAEVRSAVSLSGRR
jgi:hypothetical protein